MPYQGWFSNLLASASWLAWQMKAVAGSPASKPVASTTITASGFRVRLQGAQQRGGWVHAWAGGLLGTEGAGPG